MDRIHVTRMLMSTSEPPSGRHLQGAMHHLSLLDTNFDIRLVTS